MTRHIWAADVELQQALWQLLDGDTALKDALKDKPTDPTDSVEVSSWIEQDQIPPFIRIGDDTLDEADDKTATGVSALITIHLFSRYHGYQRVKAASARLRLLLTDKNLQVSGTHTINLYHDRTTYLREPDGKTSHAVCVYRYNSHAIGD